MIHRLPRSAPFVAALAAVVVNFGALFGRLALDDTELFVHPAIASWRTLPGALGSPWWYDTGRLYRPLALLSLGVDRQIAGGAPWLAHAENLLLHAAVAAFVVVWGGASWLRGPPSPRGCWSLCSPCTSRRLRRSSVARSCSRRWHSSRCSSS